MNFYYFDNAATTRLDNDVLREMLPYSNVVFGNASSSYKLGRNSKNAIENSRKIKPQIPLFADNGLPIRDEIEFEMIL